MARQCQEVRDAQRASSEGAGAAERGTQVIRIVELTAERVDALNSVAFTYVVDERVVPAFADGQFTWHIEPVTPSYVKTDSEGPERYAKYLGRRDCVVYLAMCGEVCVGQIVLRRNWNGFCSIDDIRVAPECKRRGIGRRLMDAAIAWAKAGSLAGLMLETTNVDAAACRFFSRCGFKLSCVDTMLFAATEARGEMALFWYLEFARS